MNASSDAAESLVRISLQGTEVALRVSGVAAKNIAAILYTILKDQRKTKGKTRLTHLLNSGKELKVFTIKKEDLALFKKEAKRYGVLFTALIDKKNKSFDGMVDIMVKADDAARINRIVKRFKLSSFDETTIKSEVQKSLNEKESKSKGVEERNIDDRLLDDILSKPLAKEETQSNPELSKTEKNPSENSLKSKKDTVEISDPEKRKSVRKELKEIKEEMTNKESKSLEQDSKSKDSQHLKSKTKVKKKKVERSK